MDYLEDERKKKESTGRGEKRKALDDRWSCLDRTVPNLEYMAVEMGYNNLGF